ncbi:hypothetical protein [Sphingobacterium deserti]|uniref:Uncharacterized protein n=1 Tax=Sphingobacterium deserti TaxID=1229276 RepID=A0A0B8SYY0_9SPHI|nr:hypothetical protein [Sphingobacterium deserti]KGE12461.1 hypothetical protein DI53_3726 [Sphingobacterium deserti]
MEETVGTSNSYPYKGQSLRVSYKGQDYSFQVLQRGLRKEDMEIKILLDGQVQLLVLREGRWYFSGSNHDQLLAQEIYRAISLRYRL